MIKQKLQDITLSITDGKHGDCEGAENSGFYFVSCKDVHDGAIHYDGARQIIEKDFLDTHKRTMLEPNDILVTNSGTIGRMALVKDTPLTSKTTFQKSVAIVKPNQEIVRPAYLYYCLLNCVNQFINQSNGSAQKNLLLGTMRNFEIEYEENFERQDKIVNILQTYDSMIENNQKQIKLLEEAAQRLYKEWFVDLRFPGYEDVEIVDGVPKGWKKVGLSEVTPILTGKKDANFGTEDGKYPFFTCAQEPIKAPSFSFDCDAVILAGNGDFNVKLYRGQFEAYQRTYVFSPYEKDNLYLLYNAVQNNMRQLFQGASGSTIKFLTKRMLEEIEVYIPAVEIRDRFNKYSENYQRKIEVLKKQIQVSMESRDRLLPKLMNGEIEV
jgi:type I restriction enzyme S subunit